MAAYSDTIVNDANAEAPIQSALMTVTKTAVEDADAVYSLLSERWLAREDPVSEAKGEGYWFQYDEPVIDASAEGVVAGERRDLVNLTVAAGRGEGTIPKQTRSQTAELLEPAAGAQSPIVAAYLALSDTVQSDAGSAGLVVSQRLAAAAPTLEAAAGASEAVVSAALAAAVTLQSDAQGEAGEPPLFWADARGEGQVVSARLRTSFTAVADANAEAATLSERLVSLFKDTVTADANASDAVQSTQLQAVQTVVNDAEAVDELLNVLSDEAWVFNAWTLAFARYTGLGVNDVVADARGRALFAAPAGVHAFSETSYADALVRFGLTNFGELPTKRLRAVYVSTMGKGKVRLVTFHGSAGALVRHDYETPERDSAVPINRRISPARGHEGQFWSVQVETTGGDRQTVTRIHVIPLITGRKL